MRSLIILAIFSTVFLAFFETPESALAIYSLPRQRPAESYILPRVKSRASQVVWHREISSVFARLWRQYFDYVKENNNAGVKNWLYDKGIIKENEPRQNQLRFF